RAWSTGARRAHPWWVSKEGSGDIVPRRKEPVMPYVSVRITPDGVTAEKKERIIAEMTRVLVEVLGKDPETTFVLIDQVATEDWGIAGTTTTKYRERKARK